MVNSLDSRFDYSADGSNAVAANAGNIARLSPEERATQLIALRAARAAAAARPPEDLALESGQPPVVEQSTSPIDQ